VLAGGVVASPVTRSFLETSPSYAQTGWGIVSPKPVGDLQGRRAIVLTGISGLDRLALSRFLRSKSIEFTIAPNTAELVSALRDGRADFGVTEMLLADQIAAREGFSAEWAPEELPRFPVVFGLWKGDLTLKRAIVDGLAQIERSGEMAKIMARYRGERAGSSKG
jgi:polar amino acid transport system substrate-binding protein/cystine transport system substrate-binding protein/membrane-bound lytic murein transglycosylase F